MERDVRARHTLKSETAYRRAMTYCRRGNGGPSEAIKDPSFLTSGTAGCRARRHASDPHPSVYISVSLSDKGCAPSRDRCIPPLACDQNRACCFLISTIRLLVSSACFKVVMPRASSSSIIRSRMPAVAMASPRAVCRPLISIPNR